MSLFQISEEDLTELERELPAILRNQMVSCNDPLTRKRWEGIKTILSNVRWNYGPWIEVEEIDINDISS